MINGLMKGDCLVKYLLKNTCELNCRLQSLSMVWLMPAKFVLTGTVLQKHFLLAEAGFRNHLCIS